MNPIKTVDGVGFIHGGGNHPLLATAMEVENCYLIPNTKVTRSVTLREYSYHNAYWGYWDEHKEDRYKLGCAAMYVIMGHWERAREWYKIHDYWRDLLNLQAGKPKEPLTEISQTNLPYDVFDKPLSSIHDFQMIDDPNFVDADGIELQQKYGAVKFKVAYWFWKLDEGQSMKDMLTKRFVNYANACLCLRCKKRKMAHVRLGVCYKCHSWVKSGLADEFRTPKKYPIKSIDEWRELVSEDAWRLQWG